MDRPSLSRFSYVCLFAAAAASLATSQPPPDWVIEDTATGEVTLSPDAEETFIHLKVASVGIASELSMEVALDPPPVSPKDSGDLSSTPILLFVGVPTVVTAGAPIPTTRLVALPKAAAPDGFEQAPSAQIPVDADQAIDIRITWKSTREERMVTKTTGDRNVTVSGPVERPVSPRRLVKIRWRARLHVDGYDDRPAGSVNVDPAS
jgi:hypothetical protein